MSPELLKLLGEIAVALSPVILGLVGLLAAKLSSLIKAKTDNALAESILVRLNDAAFTVVRELEQTMAEEFKKASADGVITPEEKKQLKAAAMAKLKSYFSFDGLGKVLGMGDSPAVEDFVSSKVEAAVAGVKAASPKSPSA